MTRRIVLLGVLALAASLPIASAAMGRLAAAFEATGETWGGYELFLLAIGILGGTSAGVGVVILWRAPGNAIGSVLPVGALALMSTFLAWPTAAYREAMFGSNDIIGGLAAWWSSNSILVGVFLLFPSVGILFPNGRLPGPGWRLPFVGLIALLVISAVLQTIAQWPPDQSGLRNPLAIQGVPMEAAALGGAIGALALFAGLGIAVVAVSVRFRRSEGVERAQLKWLLASVSLMAIAFPISFGTDIGPADLIDLLSVLAGSLIPVAVGVAILRYRLYEIDRIVSRTIGWALVTGTVVTVFAGAVVGLQAVLAAFTERQTLAVAASTLVAFALFQPVRRRIQHAVDQRLDRARYDGERMATAFTERLRDEVDIETVMSDLDRTVGTALRPSTMGIWLRGAER